MGLLVRGEGGAVVAMNRAACKFFGVADGEMVGEFLSRLCDTPSAEGLPEWAGFAHPREGPPAPARFHRSPLGPDSPGVSLVTVTHGPGVAAGEPAAGAGRIEALLSSIPDAVIVFDREGVYRQVFASRRDILARPAERLLGCSVYDVLPQQAGLMRRAFAGALERRAPQNVKYSLDLGGHLHWFAARIAAVDLTGEGEPSLLCAIQDITELEATREKLTFRLEMENLVFSLASEFLAQGRDDLAECIFRGLERILHFAGLHLAALFERLDGPGQGFRLFHRVTDLPSTPGRPAADAVFALHDLAQWPEGPDQKIAEAGLDEGPFPAEGPALVSSLPPGMKFLAAPLQQHGEIIGLLGFIARDEESSQMEECRSLLQIGAAVFSSALSRLRNLTTLEGTNRDLEHSLQAIRRRDAIMGAINFASENFLREGEWRSAMEPFLAKLAKIASAGKAFLAERAGQSPSYLAIKHLWPADSPPKPIAEEAFSGLPWVHELKKGRTVWTEQVAPEDSPPSELLGLPPGPGLLLPIFSEGQWWGMLGIANGRPKKDWTGEELDALNTAGGVLSAALHRERQNEEIHAQRDRIHAVEKISAIGKLAGGIAHDFNNILTIIMGYSDLMIHQIRDTDQPWHRYLTEIQEAGAKAQKLTRELLSYGRRQTFSPRPIDPNLFIAERLETYTRVLRENITVTFEPGSPVGHIHADGGQIEQVLINLIMNAVDAIEGDGRINIRTAACTFRRARSLFQGTGLPPGEYVRVTVSDDGSGMPPDILRHIFDPFFTTKPDGKGSGMGLPMVSSIIDQNGGFLDVESTPGEGTVFTLYFPMRPPEDLLRPDDTASGQAPSPGSGSRRARKVARILVVEDAAMVRQFVVASLMDAGYAVRECHDGAEALKLYKEEPPGAFSALVSDVVMPNMDGVSLARAIRQVEPAMPVLFMTGYADEILWSRERDGGRVECLLKPFSSKEMLDRLASLLAGVAESS